MTKKKAPAHVTIEVVVDRSGSMGMIANDAIGGYNTWLSAQQALPGEATLTLTLFDHEFIVSSARPIREAPPLSSETYVPRGSTALNDAIGRALGRLEAANPDKAILVILTDGQENSSTEFSKEQIKERITKAQERGWQVVYLSAHIDAFAHSAQYGVRASNTMQFTADAAGVARAYSSTVTLNSSYRSGDDSVTLEDTDTQKK